MNGIRVIKKNVVAEVGRSLDPDRGGKPTKHQLVEVVGGWVTDWRKRSEMETREALKECARFRVGSSLKI